MLWWLLREETKFPVGCGNYICLKGPVKTRMRHREGSICTGIKGKKKTSFFFDMGADNNYLKKYEKKYRINYYLYFSLIRLISRKSRGGSAPRT